MEIKNREGKIVKVGFFADDILKRHLSTKTILAKRNLDYDSREEFLADLRKVLIKNPKLFRKMRMKLKRNDEREEVKPMIY